MFGQRLRYLFIFLLSAYSYLNIIFTEGDKLFGFEPSPLLFFGILFAIVCIIWEGNRAIGITLQRFNFKFHPLLVHFLVSGFLVLLTGLLTTAFIHFSQHIDTTTTLTLKLSLGFAFRINLFLNCINAIVFFMNQNRQNQIEKEVLLKETAQARFEALRNQVNPHFLFNSLNVLSALVYKDADTANSYIEQLSKVYRYLLRSQSSDLVTVEEEMAFLEAYVFLLKIRFGDSLVIENALDLKVRAYHIAPATLQMLIENAIKHNIISKSDPLTITVRQEGDYIVVENNIQLKPVNPVSTSTGLENIRQRYNFLSGKEALIVHSNGKYTVKIPMIESDNEYSNSRR